ncbi:hypothetical protein SAMN05421677_101253 [Halobacillus aidingensis]|uniref:Uncharacterized protein n=1 Tax=Halobacillus aidingensis TaxID=240303 RepID=A0A1H0ENI6_HALAD|nr:hypothetical protein SAMN05421677_101253 [Halobacillus aidingensis]
MWFRDTYGKGAEANGETPAGKKCLVRPHRTQSEEAHRAPAESEPFPVAPIHSTKVSKLSLPHRKLIWNRGNLLK